MSIKTVFISIFTFLALSTLQANNKQPNILFISVDDLKPVLGCYNNQHVKSPNIDQLAAEGVLFQNAYCQQAVCAPSRISLFTGLRPDATQVWDLQTRMRDKLPNVVTMPQYLIKNGYQTIGLGKLMHGAKNNDLDSWTIPYKEDDHLTYAKGFNYPANGKYQTPEIHNALKIAKQQKLGWKETNVFLKSKGLAPSVECLDIPDNAYEDGAIAEHAVEYLDAYKKGDKPFFLALGFHKPHLPFAAPKKYWDMYKRESIPTAQFTQKAENAPKYAYHTWGELRNYSDIAQKGQVSLDKQKELIHGYWASVSFVDAQIGKVMHKLKSKGLYKNTIVVLWGDHGWHLGDHGLWCKHSNFEQATQVPLIFSAPGYRKGKSTEAMAELVDVYPTLLELAGLEIPDVLEGESQAHVLNKPYCSVKDYAISQYPRKPETMGYSLRTKQYRLTLWLKGDYYKNEIISNPHVLAEELYDYKNDPLETRSLADDEKYKEIKMQLKKKLIDLLQKQNNERKI